MSAAWHLIFRRPWIWAAVLLCAALIGGWFIMRPPRELSVEAYVWQKRDSPELREALGRSMPLLTRRHFLGVEMARDSSGWRVSRSSLPDELFKGQGLVLRLGASLAGETWKDEQTMARVMDEAAWLAAKPAAELQIDYDCPQRSLGSYRMLLENIKSRFPEKRWTITALPSWLGEPSAKELFETADGVVLQVHSLQLPDQPQRPVILCDPAAAREAVRKMSRLGVPFRVALNTYGCEVLFHENGSVLDVVSEDRQSSPPKNARRRSVGISDAAELANLVAGWKSNPPRGLRGIVWYRLPLDSDRRNWRWVTWVKVAAGEAPVSALRIKAGKTPTGAWDLILSNNGERDERLPEFITPGCETLVLEGLNGYGAETAMQLRLENTPWPWLPPGTSLTVGWLRPADSTISPNPGIAQSP